MKILVTGADGFIGCHVVDALVALYGADKIITVGKLQKNPCQNVVSDYKNGYLGLDAESLDKITIILHLGGWIPKVADFANDLDGASSNISFTKALLQLSFKNLKKVVFVSTFGFLFG